MVVLAKLVEVMLMAAVMATVIAIAMDLAIVEAVSKALSMASMVYLNSLVYVFWAF